jgi:hypothetical protein
MLGGIQRDELGSVWCQQEVIKQWVIPVQVDSAIIRIKDRT